MRGSGAVMEATCGAEPWSPTSFYRGKLRKKSCFPNTSEKEPNSDSAGQDFSPQHLAGEA